MRPKPGVSIYSNRELIFHSAVYLTNTQFLPRSQQKHTTGYMGRDDSPHKLEPKTDLRTAENRKNSHQTYLVPGKAACYWRADRYSIDIWRCFN